MQTREDISKIKTLKIYVRDMMHFVGNLYFIADECDHETWASLKADGYLGKNIEDLRIYLNMLEKLYQEE